jgi:hypothetical protein
VRVSKGSATFERPNAFTVVPLGIPKLETSVIAPSVVGFRVRVPQTIWIDYKNTGDAPMPAPLLMLSVDQGGRITADPSLTQTFPTVTDYTLPGVTNTVQVLATGSGATPGILQPGESGRIRVYYLGRDIHGDTTLTFSLSDLTADDVTWHYSSSSTVVHVLPDGTREIVTTTTTTGEDWHVNWSSVGAAVRPESIPTDAWDAVVTNLAADIGPDWGNYVEVIADDANFLHGVGQDTQDVGQLWNFEVAQASASLSPVRYLTGSVDASVPTPGLPLSFSRVYGESITSRYQLGSLGWGWSTSWDVRAETQINGDVVLRGPGGVDRFFTLSHGTYVGAAGDHGQLTFVSVRRIAFLTAVV